MRVEEAGVYEGQSVGRLQVLGGLPHDGSLRDAGRLAQEIGHRLGGRREDGADHAVDVVALDQLPRLVDGDHWVGAVVLFQILERSALPLVAQHVERGENALLGQFGVIGHKAREPLGEPELDRLAARAPGRLGAARCGLGAARSSRRRLVLLAAADGENGHRHDDREHQYE